MIEPTEEQWDQDEDPDIHSFLVESGPEPPQDDDVAPD